LIPFDLAPFLPDKAVLQRLKGKFGFRRFEGGYYSSRKGSDAFEDGEKGEGDGMGLFMLAVQAGIGGAGKLHEEQGGVVFPGRGSIRAEGNLLTRGGGEYASLKKTGEVSGGLEAHMVVKGEQEGVQATTEEETAVIFAANAHRRETKGEGIPVLSGGKLPNNGVEQEARGCVGATPPPTLPPAFPQILMIWRGERTYPTQHPFLPIRGHVRIWRGEFSIDGWKTLENRMVVFHDDKIIELTGGIVLCETQAIGGDDDGGFAGEKIQAWVGRDEGGQDGPLTVGEVGGETFGATRR